MSNKEVEKTISSFNELFKLLDNDIADGDDVIIHYSWLGSAIRKKWTSPINMMAVYAPLQETASSDVHVDKLRDAESLATIIRRIYEAVLRDESPSIKHGDTVYKITEDIKSDIFYQMEDSIRNRCALTKKYCGDSYGIPAITEEELRDIIGHGGMPCEGEDSDRIAWGNEKGGESHEEAHR